MIARVARLFRSAGVDGSSTGGDRKGLRNLYVIRLDDAVLRHRKFRERNPDYRRRRFGIFGKPCVYVGETWHPPEIRFQKHKDGDNSARFVQRYGKRLMRTKYEHLNPVPAEVAKDREEELAIDLQRRGYGVWWN